MCVCGGGGGCGGWRGWHEDAADYETGQGVEGEMRRRGRGVEGWWEENSTGG